MAHRGRETGRNEFRRFRHPRTEQLHGKIVALATRSSMSTFLRRSFFGQMFVVFFEPGVRFLVLFSDEPIVNLKMCCHGLLLFNISDDLSLSAGSTPDYASNRLSENMSDINVSSTSRNPSCNPPSTGITWPVVFDNRCEQQEDRLRPDLGFDWPSASAIVWRRTAPACRAMLRLLRSPRSYLVLRKRSDHAIAREHRAAFDYRGRSTALTRTSGAISIASSRTR